MKTINRIKERGFSLLELIVVLAIIAILAVALIAIGEHVKQKAYATHMLQTLTAMCTNMRSYYDSVGGYANFNTKQPLITDFETTSSGVGKLTVGLNDSAQDVDNNKYALGALTSGTGTNADTMVITVTPGLGGLGAEQNMLDQIAHISSDLTASALWHTTGSVTAATATGSGSDSILCNLN